MKKDDNNYLFWIDGLKLLACIGVFWSHFCSAFIYSAEHISPFIVNITQIFSMLLNGAFQVRLFCIISGLLASYKVVKTLHELIESIVRRYLRFVIPFFSLGLILILIEYTIGYHSVECGRLLNMTWLEGHNTTRITMMDILKLTFFFDHSFDGSLWTVPCIFVGSCLVYVISYLLHILKIPQKYWGICFLALFFVSIIKYTIASLCVSCCILGAGIRWTWEKLRIPDAVANTIIGITVLMVTFLHSYIYDLLVGLGIDIPVRFELDGYGDVVYGGILLICIYNSDLVKKLLHQKMFINLGDMSFSLYIIHMPLIMSVSAWICMQIYGNCGYTVNCIINFLLSTIIVGIVSYLYSSVVDKYQIKLLNMIDNKYLKKKNIS